MTIVPRTSAVAGFAQYVPSDRYLLSQDEVRTSAEITSGLIDYFRLIIDSQ